MVLILSFPCFLSQVSCKVLSFPLLFRGFPQIISIVFPRVYRQLIICHPNSGQHCSSFSQALLKFPFLIARPIFNPIILLQAFPKISLFSESFPQVFIRLVPGFPCHSLMVNQRIYRNMIFACFVIPIHIRQFSKNNRLV